MLSVAAGASRFSRVVANSGASADLRASGYHAKSSMRVTLAQGVVS